MTDDGSNGAIEPAAAGVATGGHITYTRGPTGVWIAWHTLARVPAGATGRDIAASEGPVLFAVGATAEEALARLREQHPGRV